MHQSVRPIKLPNWVERVCLIPIPAAVPVAAAEHDEPVHMPRCNLPPWSPGPREHEALSGSDLWDIEPVIHGAGSQPAERCASSLCSGIYFSLTPLSGSALSHLLHLLASAQRGARCVSSEVHSGSLLLLFCAA